MKIIALLLALAVTGCSTPELESLKTHVDHCRGLSRDITALKTTELCGPRIYRHNRHEKRICLQIVEK